MAAEKDIFGYRRNKKAKGAFSTDNSLLTFGGGSSAQSAEGYLVQSWQVAYNQDVTEILELGSTNLYWAKGRPTGAGQISRIIGPSADSSSLNLFPAEAYDICSGGAMFVITAKGGGCEPTNGLADVGQYGVRLELDACVITSVGFTATVADTRLMEAISWRFGNLTVAGFEQ